jgi:hypothetical protein
VQIFDPESGQVVWNGVDSRVEPDDMFVALQETNGELFWCTNHGHYGFVDLSSVIDEDFSTAEKPYLMEGFVNLFLAKLTGI